ncbi:MAG: transcription-repair coupling factor [Oceanicaulis sp.]|uniref:transcription-repair coupling factor n=1 Tax=unclassified Oceanicaulis TaxID=2632123 RepID=UPI000C4D56E1|nr:MULTISPECIES: transcription-repair coupling factor [unclassified Oceanicaulis]MBC40034.1 transcription-repair coupling factor [Oceanicaulis sp.]MBG37114.1 transcription-repair coupling factor [Oceanicaulis sp.]HCR93738.1 transcription-repair coupling factor [Oceanicaulis sp.]
MDDFKTLAQSPHSLTVCGAPEGFDSLIFCDALRARGGVGLYIATDEARASAFAAAARFFALDLPVLRLLGWDCQPYDRISPSPRTAARRAGALHALAQRDATDTSPLLVISTVSGVIQRCAPKAALSGGGLSAKPGGVLDSEKLKQHLAENGYVRTATVTERGDYAVRGGVIDVFPADAEEPVRLDFFGDVLETVRAFDPETQRTTTQLKSVSFSPVSEIVLNADAISRFRSGFLKNFGAVGSGDPIYDSVSAGARPTGAEHWLPLFHERLDTVFDYVGEGALVGLDPLAKDALDERLAQIRDYYEARQLASKSGAGAMGAPAYRALEPQSLYLDEDEWAVQLGQRATRRFTAFHEAGDDVIDMSGKQGRSFAAERQADQNVFEAASKHAVSLRSSGKRVLFASWSEGASDRLASVLSDHGLKPIMAADDWRAVNKMSGQTISRIVLPLEHGFETSDFAIIAEQDVLGDRLARPRRRKKSADVIAEAGALTPGDLVVHADHGLGRYLGLKTLSVGEAPHDCLELEYAGESKLYLPVENIELLSRYGQDSETAQLDRLGAGAWQARKAKAKQRLRDMADQLIKIAAARNARDAEIITPPSGLYEEFAARFPYVETDDQLNAIDDVFSDFAKGRPMDRLICGDVGFGKTEVALRAAFVAAMSGRQVAIVAPTTLLARQHFKTFEERFKGWPVKVRQLSRLVSTKEATATRKELADGTCEIVIGTHAILAKTVKFADLGLLVIDEEQRFGVKHKERLKELKTDVHVLTLTATPIPRTLQLSMAGIRDLSIIATPPVDRLAVRTYVTPFDSVTVREALLRERYRGGQSYYVAPRISDLEDIASFLREQVPEVSFVIAHGQMAGGQLEDIMTAFYEGRYDVLVSTTIVESGIDIPTANTMIIHRADMFGLAPLYQLRGRVGRAKARAYAYLTTPANQKLTATADKRLKILQSLDSLGAGFTLASHDLDLRGGGNLLGEEQSGHIKDVGVELYQSMLEEAVASLQGDMSLEERDWSPAINVGAAVLIPEDYVPDLDVRMALYRRLSSLDTKQEREGFAAELIDRFGKLPDEVESLLQVVALKALCKRANVAKLDAGPKGAVATFREHGFGDPAALVELMTKRPADYKLRPDNTLVLKGDFPEPMDRLKGALRLLAPVADAARKAKEAA